MFVELHLKTLKLPKVESVALNVYDCKSREFA